ncbi:hypothetical protein VU08_04760, partial [Desulfobulbus sp. F5]|nr:hypothetical protein [Desulfobulbus sp. F5]
KFEKCLNPFTRSELTMLFLDIVTCPFITEKTKRYAVQKTKYATKNLSEAIEQISSAKRWFMDWDTEIDLERVIKRKEFGSASAY